MFPKGHPSIECPCGFLIVGADEAKNAEVFTEHSCPRQLPDIRWHQSVFSARSALIVAIVAYAVVAALTGGAW